MMHRAGSNDLSAVVHLERAVSLDCSPMQLLRLLLELGLIGHRFLTLRD